MDNLQNPNIPHVKNKAMLNIIQTRENEIVYVDEEKTLYKFKDSKWNKLESKSQVKLSLYDINKGLMLNKQKLSESEIKEGKTAITKWYKEKENKYYALISNDINYYTLFVLEPNGKLKLADEVTSCAQDYGEILEISEREDGDCIEVWIKTKKDVILMYLIPYDIGVIVVGE